MPRHHRGRRLGRHPKLLSHDGQVRVNSWVPPLERARSLVQRERLRQLVPLVCRNGLIVEQLVVLVVAECARQH
jgi:hypothetical protein|eukprot:jgi/Chrpa1/10925/Chrysochromulina_OHIO_Genome00003102-RA